MSHSLISEGVKTFQIKIGGNYDSKQGKTTLVFESEKVI